jgi:hypothetical protein
MLASTRATATEEVDEGQKDDSAQQRNQQGANRKVTGVDCRHAEQWGQKESRECCADDSDQDIQKDTLLSVCSHYFAGNPAKDATDNDD